MRFLADENVEGTVIAALRACGHDVAVIADEMAGVKDRAVLIRSVAEGRILVTNDKDFAELAFLQRSAATGILLIRLPDAGSREKALRVAAAVADLSDRLADAMTVVEPRATRRRSLPRPAASTRDPS